MYAGSIPTPASSFFPRQSFLAGGYWGGHRDPLVTLTLDLSAQKIRFTRGYVGTGTDGSPSDSSFSGQVADHDPHVDRQVL